MLYFLEKSFKVLSVELNEFIAQQFFVENKLFSTKKSDKFVVFSSKILIFIVVIILTLMLMF